MAFKDLFGLGQKEVGDPNAIKQWTQQPNLNYPQQAAQYAMLARGLGGLFQQQPNFEPIKQQYMREYRNNTLPGILSDATNSGFGQQGSGFQKAVAGADTDLAYRLAALQQNFNQHQFDKNREYSQNLLQTGMKPSHENVYGPVPYQAAEEYLKRRGNPNPSQQDIEKALPMFQTTPTLAQQAGSVANQGYQKGKDVYDIYKNRGIKGLKDLAQGEMPLSNQTAGGGVNQTVSESLASTPAIQKAMTESLPNALPDQKAAADWIIANKKFHMPLMSQKLEPQDYVMLKSLMENTKPGMEKLAYSITTKKDLDELRKVIENAGNDVGKINKYILRRYGIKE